MKPASPIPVSQLSEAFLNSTLGSAKHVARAQAALPPNTQILGAVMGAVGFPGQPVVVVVTPHEVLCYQTGSLRWSVPLKGLRVEVDATGRVLLFPLVGATQDVRAWPGAKRLSKLIEESVASAQSRKGDFTGTVAFARGLPLLNGERCEVELAHGGLRIFNHPEGSELAVATSSDLLEFTVGGPGLVNESPGIIGGGFGFEGAAKGMMYASALNSFGATSHIETLIRVGTAGWTVTILTSELTVEQVQARAPIVAPKAHHSPVGSAGLGAELEKLASLHAQGLLTSEEFSAAKARLLNG